MCPGGGFTFGAEVQRNQVKFIVYDINRACPVFLKYPEDDADWLMLAAPGEPFPTFGHATTLSILQRVPLQACFNRMTSTPSPTRTTPCEGRKSPCNTASRMIQHASSSQLGTHPCVLSAYGKRRTIITASYSAWTNPVHMFWHMQLCLIAGVMLITSERR
jgi:hypothetical protein